MRSMSRGKRQATPRGTRTEADDISVEELGRLRQEFRRRCEEKLKQVRFFSADDWLTAALAGAVPEMQSTDRDLLIAIHGVAASRLGAYWTGLLVIDPQQPRGHAWFNDVEGIVPLEAALRVREGHGAISRDLLEELGVLLDPSGLQAFQSVPEDVYGGAPTRVKLCSRRAPQVHEISVNAANTSGGNSLALAKSLWRILAATNLIETERHG
jgi:hypothetical protein